jgi:hypothetical protein
VPSLFRVIAEDDDGRPLISHLGSKGLGVRPGYDITADEDGIVMPDTGGCSVASDIRAIPTFLLPPEHGGTGKNPLWELDTDELPEYLTWREDPDRDGHYFIEPAYPMELSDFQEAVASTRDLWNELPGG